MKRKKGRGEMGRKNDSSAGGQEKGDERKASAAPSRKFTVPSHQRDPLRLGMSASRRKGPRRASDGRLKSTRVLAQGRWIAKGKKGATSRGIEGKALPRLLVTSKKGLSCSRSVNVRSPVWQGTQSLPSRLSIGG